jgi:inosine/xanthosine triphosphate pyrophosphatase family protein
MNQASFLSITDLDLAPTKINQVSDRLKMTTALVLATHNSGKTQEMQAWLNSWQNTSAFNQQIIYHVQNISHLEPCPEPHDTFLENAIAKAKYAAKHTQKLSLADDSGLCIPFINYAPGVVSADFSDHFFNFLQQFFPNDAEKIWLERLSIEDFKSVQENQTRLPKINNEGENCFAKKWGQKNTALFDAIQMIVANDFKHQYHIYHLIFALFLTCQKNNINHMNNGNRSEQLKASNISFLDFKTPAYYQTSLVLASPKSPDLYIAQARWQVEFRVKGYQGAYAKSGFGYDSHIFIPELGCYVCELSVDEKNQISHRGQALQKMQELLLEYNLSQP